MSEDERLDRLLRGFEDAIVAASDADLDASDGSKAVAGIVGGVLKAYGYQRDGARQPVSWRRGRVGRRAASTRLHSRARVAEEPLRASFSVPNDDYDDDNDGGADR